MRSLSRANARMTIILQDDGCLTSLRVLFMRLKRICNSYVGHGSLSIRPPDLDRHVFLPRQFHPEPPGEHPAVLHGHLPGVDHPHLEGRGVVEVELPEGGPHEAVVVEVVALHRLEGLVLRHGAHLVPAAAVVGRKARAGGLLQNVRKQPEPLPALAPELPAVGPPQCGVFALIQIRLPVPRIAAPTGRLPEAAGHLPGGEVAPAVLDVALVGDLVQHHRLAEPLPPLVHQLRRLVQVLALDAAMGDPRAGVVVEGDAVVDGDNGNAIVIRNANQGYNSATIYLILEYTKTTD